MNKEASSPEFKQNIFERDNFICQKCGFQDLKGKDLEIYYKNKEINGGNENNSNLVTLCSICSRYAPEDKEDIDIYLNEKIGEGILNTFRKSNKSISKITKKGMTVLFNKGELVTRAPKGYKMVNKELLPAEDSYVIQEIYEAFLNYSLSLTQLSKNYGLSVNGLKKVLSNVSYLGKIKFAGQAIQGKHAPLISQELFDKVQKKLTGD